MMSKSTKTASCFVNERRVPLRTADEVMQLERMGSFHQTRLSFMRALLRQLKADKWRFSRPKWDVDANGVGVAIYQATGPARTYSLVCFSHDLPPEKRSDRVIADQWDATFALFDGIPTDSDIVRLSKNVPHQEAGQLAESELTLSRANRSVRLFSHVIERLSNGEQPDVSMIDQVGYLMRTTAVYGNGKFGLSDRERIADREEFVGAFRSELLAVWLIRWFSTDIVEHLASVRSPKDAVKLDPAIRRRLGVGNSTGLGMAPFLVTHPAQGCATLIRPQRINKSFFCPCWLACGKSPRPGTLTTRDSLIVLNSCALKF